MITGQKENDSVLNGDKLSDASVMGLCSNPRKSLWLTSQQALCLCHHSGHYGFLSSLTLRSCYGTNRVLPSGSNSLWGTLCFSFSCFF